MNAQNQFININIEPSKFCSLLQYTKFGTLYKFACSTFIVIADLLFHFLPCIITSSLTAFNILEVNGHRRTEKSIKIREYWLST